MNYCSEIQRMWALACAGVHARSFTWNKQKTRGCKGYSCQQIRSEPKQTTSTECRETERENREDVQRTYLLKSSRKMVCWNKELKEHKLSVSMWWYRVERKFSTPDPLQGTSREIWSSRNAHYKIEAKQLGPCEWFYQFESQQNEIGSSSQFNCELNS